MASNVVYLTEAGLQKLKDELDHLRSVRRHNCFRRDPRKPRQGDLSRMQSMMRPKELRAWQSACRLEVILRCQCKVLDESRIDTSTVQILNRVTLKNITTGKVADTWFPKTRPASKKGNCRSVPRSLYAARTQKGRRGRRYRSVGRAAFRDTEYFDLNSGKRLGTGLCKAVFFYVGSGSIRKNKKCRKLFPTLLFKLDYPEPGKRYFTVLTIFSNAAALFIARSARTFRLSRIPLAFILPMNSE